MIESPVDDRLPLFRPQHSPVVRFEIECSKSRLIVPLGIFVILMGFEESVS